MCGGRIMKRRLELNINFCKECPYCQLSVNFLNYGKSKFCCHHPDNIEYHDVIITLDEIRNIKALNDISYDDPNFEWPPILESCPLEKIE